VQKCIGYTYSLVLAVDMYATVFKKDPLVGAALENICKNKILLVGGSQDETVSL
jgi:Zn-dependent oligopeptidase